MNSWDCWKYGGSATVGAILVHFWEIMCDAVYSYVVQSHGSLIVEFAPSIPCCH